MIELWHIASSKKALEVFDSGLIPLSHRDQEPKKRVFAYDEETARSVSKYGEPSDIWITFVVPKIDVWVGDLRLEGSPEYKDSLLPYVRYEYGKKYEEAEMMVSHPVKAKGFYERRTFKPVNRGEIEGRIR